MTKIPEEQRKKINNSVNQLEYSARRQWYRSTVTCQDVRARRALSKTTDNCHRKQNTFSWTLPSETGTATVCKGFYLTTLGFAAMNSDAVTSAVTTGNGVVGDTDKRGRLGREPRVTEDDIRKHIWTFKPIKHHYRYEHAPNRYYLSADVTVTSMYHDFVTGRSPEEGQCSFETYRKVIKKMNISFTRLAGEECSKCSSQIQHNAETLGNSRTADCEVPNTDRGAGAH